MNAHHFNHFNFGLNSQMIQERFQIFFHLYGIVLHLGDSEDAQFAISPCTMLFQ